MTEPPMRDLVVLHLEGYGRFRDDTPVPPAVSPSGVRDAIGVERAGVAERVEVLSTLDRLEEAGLVTSDVRTVEGGHRRNVYFLTDDGRDVARETRDRWRTEPIPVPEADEDLIPVERATKYVEDGSMVTVLATAREGRVGTEVTTDRTGLVGREAERATVEAALSRVPEAGSRTLLITGAAGSGKTTLLSELTRQASEEGYATAVGAARRDGDDPYAPFRNAFAGVDGRVVDRLMAGDLPAPEASDDVDTQRVALFADVRDAVRDLAADGPLVLAIDDLQWADEATLELLAYLAESITEWIYPVLFVAGYRPEAVAADDAFASAVERLRDRDAATEVSLSGLATHHVHTLLRAVLGDHEAPDEFVDRLGDVTGGNPLFVAECVRYLQEDGRLDVAEGVYPEDLSTLDPPAAVADAIGRRLDRLDETGRRVVATAAVIGDTVRWGLLSAALPLSDPDLRDYVDLLVESGVLEETAEGGVGFRGEFARDTALDLLDSTALASTHATVAGAIQTVDANEAGEQYGRIAYHYEAAGAPLRALAHYRRAAEQATDVYALETAREAFRSAIDLAERLDRRAEGTQLWEALGQLNRQASAFDAAEECFETVRGRTDDPATRARIANARSLMYTHQGEYEAAVEQADHGLSVCDDDPSPPRCRLFGQRGWARMVRGSLDAARADFERERTLATAIDDRELLGQAHHHLGSVAYMTGDLDAGIEHMSTAIETRDRAGDERGLAASLNNLSAMQWKAGRIEDARESIERSLALTRKRNDRVTEARMTVNLGLYVEKSGDWEAATDHYADCLETVTELDIHQTAAVALENLGWLSLRRGDLDDAEDRFDRALALNRDIDHTRQSAIVHDGLAALAALRDRPAAAREHAETALDLAREVGDAEREAKARGRLGDVNRREGRLDAAVDCHERGLELAEETGAVEVRNHNRRGLALDHRAADRPEAALDRAETALEAIDDTTDPWLRSRTLLVRGECLEAAGRTEAAVEDLSAADRLSRELGARLTECRAAIGLEAARRAMGERERADDHRERARDLIETCGFERLSTVGTASSTERS